MNIDVQMLINFQEMKFETLKLLFPRNESPGRKLVNRQILKDPEIYKDQVLTLAGGGDSALDWAIYLADIAKEVGNMISAKVQQSASVAAVRSLHKMEGDVVNKLLSSEK